MKQFKINQAYIALTRLSEMKLPIKAAYGVYVLTKQLSTPYEFSLQQEKGLIEKYHGNIQKDGMISFQSSEDTNNFQKELIELNNFEQEIEIKPVTINISDLNGQSIIPSDIISLEGFVNFVD